MLCAVVLYIAAGISKPNANSILMEVSADASTIGHQVDGTDTKNGNDRRQLMTTRNSWSWIAKWLSAQKSSSIAETASGWCDAFGKKWKDILKGLYELKTSGSCDTFVTTSAECDKAADALDLSDTTSQSSSGTPQTPTGCYKKTGSNAGLWIGDGGADCSSTRTCICKSGGSAMTTQAPSSISWTAQPSAANRYCEQGLDGASNTYRGTLSTSESQCKDFCASESTCAFITYYSGSSGCSHSDCKVNGQSTRCRLSESCFSPASTSYPSTAVFQKSHVGNAGAFSNYLCDASAWPNTDNVCGDCKAVVTLSGTSCNTFCEGRGLTCKAAWYDVDGECSTASSHTCSLEQQKTVCECETSSFLQEAQFDQSQIHDRKACLDPDTPEASACGCFDAAKEECESLGGEPRDIATCLIAQACKEDGICDSWKANNCDQVDTTGALVQGALLQRAVTQDLEGAGTQHSEGDLLDSSLKDKCTG